MQSFQLSIDLVTLSSVLWQSNGEIAHVLTLAEFQSVK